MSDKITIKVEEVYRDDLAVVENLTFDPPLTVAAIRRMKEQLMGAAMKRKEPNTDEPDFIYDLVREDGRLERMCKHGIGHTVGHKDHRMLAKDYIWIHGCDGCCNDYVRMK